MHVLNERYRGSKGLEIQSWQTIIHWFIAIYLLSWFFFWISMQASKKWNVIKKLMMMTMIFFSPTSRLLSFLPEMKMVIVVVKVKQIWPFGRRRCRFSAKRISFEFLRRSLLLKEMVLMTEWMNLSCYVLTSKDV